MIDPNSECCDPASEVVPKKSHAVDSNGSNSKFWPSRYLWYIEDVLVILQPNIPSDGERDTDNYQEKDHCFYHRVDMSCKSRTLRINERIRSDWFPKHDHVDIGSTDVKSTLRKSRRDETGLLGARLMEKVRK